MSSSSYWTTPHRCEAAGFLHHREWLDFEIRGWGGTEVPCNSQAFSVHESSQAMQPGRR